MRGQSRQRDDEGGPAPRALACGADRSAVQLGQLLDQRQPQPQAAEAPRHRSVGLPEAVEDVRQKFRLDALAAVDYDDADAFGVALHPQLDPPAFGGEFDGVREQVPNYLLQAVRVATHHFGLRAEMGDQLDSFRLGRRAYGAERGFYRGR